MKNVKVSDDYYYRKKFIKAKVFFLFLFLRWGESGWVGNNAFSNFIGYFTETFWNYVFPPLTFFRIHSRFSDFYSGDCIFSVKKYYFQMFSDFLLQYLFYCFYCYATYYLAKLVHQLKVVRLSWNLVPCIVRIFGIQWWCSFLLFLTRNTLFRQNLVQKIEIVTLRSNLLPRLISNMQKLTQVFTFSVLDQKYLF